MLAIVSFLRRIIEIYLPFDILSMKIMSEILFSFVPILISSKILYVLKIRQNGMGEYNTILKQYFIYNFCYFSVALVCLSFYLSIFYIVLEDNSLLMTFLMTMFFIFPLVYVMIYFSLSPIVAIFEETTFKESFIQSRNLTKKNVGLVLINHLAALFPPIAFLGLGLIKSDEYTILISFIFAIPESMLIILTVLTTVRVYLYLNEVN